MAGITISGSAPLSGNVLMVQGTAIATGGGDVTIIATASENLTVVGTGSATQPADGVDYGWGIGLTPVAGSWSSGGTALVLAQLIDSNNVQIATAQMNANIT